MRNENKNKMTTAQALKLFESMGKSLYWLQAMINLNYINRAQAGLIINKGGIKWESFIIKRQKYFMLYR